MSHDTGVVATRERVYRPFKEARKFVKRLNLKSRTEWFKYCKGEMPEKGICPDDIPFNPNNTYENKGWKSVGDWLGTGTIAPYNRVFRPFKEARKFVRSLNLKSETEWRKYCKGEMPEKGLGTFKFPIAVLRDAPVVLFLQIFELLLVKMLWINF